MNRRFVRRTRPWPRWLESLVVALVLLGMAVFAKGLEVEDITGTGPYAVVDGDSLRFNGQDIRLHGIDAPELNQKCLNSAALEYACGRDAKSQLRTIIRGRKVSCKKREIDRYGRQVANCQADSVDINREMVKLGWAVAYTKHSSLFLKEQRLARAAKRGIWQGKFEAPESYRERNRVAKSSAEVLTGGDED